MTLLLSSPMNYGIRIYVCADSFLSFAQASNKKIQGCGSDPTPINVIKIVYISISKSN